MAIILYIWLLLIIFLAFVNLKRCLCLYLAYLILVPFLNIELGGINLQYNLINFILLIGFITKYKSKLKRIDFETFKPFLFLYGFYLLMIPIQDFSFSFSMNLWRADVMSTILFPFVVWNAYRFDPSLKGMLEKTFIICISIALIYGLILTLTPGINPYLMLILPVNGTEFNEAYAFADDGRVFGRISSVFTHPMTFGVFICLSTIYLTYIRRNNEYKIASILFITCILNALFCGVRSAIAGLIIAFMTYIILSRKLKQALGMILLTIVLMIIINNISGMDSYVSSIIDFENQEETVKGSSLELRKDQLYGALKEIEGAELIGKGYGWVANYLVTKGDHPILLAFESLIFVVLCNNGILGIIAWIVSLYLYYKQIKKYKEEWIFLLTLYITYVAYSCITGEYGYMKFTIIFYVMMLINTRENNKLKIRQNI